MAGGSAYGAETEGTREKVPNWNGADTRSACNEDKSLGAVFRIALLKASDLPSVKLIREFELIERAGGEHGVVGVEGAPPVLALRKKDWGISLIAVGDMLALPFRRSTRAVHNFRS
jgi:hypothetical protein